MDKKVLKIFGDLDFIEKEELDLKDNQEDNKERDLGNKKTPNPKMVADAMVGRHNPSGPVVDCGKTKGYAFCMAFLFTDSGLCRYCGSMDNIRAQTDHLPLCHGIIHFYNYRKPYRKKWRVFGNLSKNKFRGAGGTTVKLVYLRSGKDPFGLEPIITTKQKQSRYAMAKVMSEWMRWFMRPVSPEKTLLQFNDSTLLFTRTIYHYNMGFGDIAVNGVSKEFVCLLDQEVEVCFEGDDLFVTLVKSRIKPTPSDRCILVLDY